MASGPIPSPGRRKSVRVAILKSPEQNRKDEASLNTLRRVFNCLACSHVFLKLTSRSVLLVVLAAMPASAEPLFGLPARLSAGRGSVRSSNLSILDPGPGARDPWCGTSTYDGHKGTDFRVLSMRDVDRGVEVVAMAGRGRQGRPRQVWPTGWCPPIRIARRSVRAECGNGLVLDHGDGFETQYCHMRQGSLRLAPGAQVRKGDVLGFVGASGLAAFPHIHVSLRRDGKEIDPFTGLSAGEACTTLDASSAGGAGLLDADAIAALGRPDLPTVLSAGFADGVVNDRQFVKRGDSSIAGTPFPGTGRVHLGDQPGRRRQVHAPDSKRTAGLSANSSPNRWTVQRRSMWPLPGRKSAPQAGLYRLEAAILRQGDKIAIESRDLTVD